MFLQFLYAAYANKTRSCHVIEKNRRTKKASGSRGISISLFGLIRVYIYLVATSNY